VTEGSVPEARWHAGFETETCTDIPKLFTDRCHACLICCLESGAPGDPQAARSVEARLLTAFDSSAHGPAVRFLAAPTLARGRPPPALLVRRSSRTTSMHGPPFFSSSTPTSTSIMPSSSSSTTCLAVARSAADFVGFGSTLEGWLALSLCATFFATSRRGPRVKAASRSLSRFCSAS